MRDSNYFLQPNKPVFNVSKHNSDSFLNINGMITYKVFSFYDVIVAHLYPTQLCVIPQSTRVDGDELVSRETEETKLECSAINIVLIF